MRGMTILWILLSGAVVVSLFTLKYQVQELEKELAGLNRQIYENQESIHVLKAEWTYLLDPTRLRELAEKHLNMRSVQPNQVAAALSDTSYAPVKGDNAVAIADASAATEIEEPEAAPRAAAKKEKPTVRRDESQSRPTIVPAPVMLASRPQARSTEDILVIKSPALRAAEAARGAR